MMRLSVVMPVYNGGPYLKAALDSIRGQSFPDYELIVIDDGSTDDSLRVLSAAAAEDRRIRVVSRENRGLTITLNEGLALARGDYVARMDSDDISLPERFALQVAYLDKHPDCGLVGGQIVLIDPDGRKLTSLPLLCDPDAIVSAMLDGKVCFAHPAVMFRREIALQIGSYSVDYDCAEDIDFFLRMSEVTKLANLTDTLLLYRQSLNSISHQNAKRQNEAGYRATRDAAIRRGLPVRPPTAPGQPETRQEIVRRWAWWALHSGEVGTARHHAAAALKSGPFDRENWRLAYCALRGR